LTVDPIDPASGERFAWCFSHGRLHRFDAQPWCTALWTSLAGNTEQEALADKQTRFGDAQFEHQLPFAEQAKLHGLTDEES
jgi:hypothetical protein